MTSYGEICLKNSPKRGVNRQFQAKTPKSIHRNISKTINPTNKRFEDRVQTTKGTSWVVRHYAKANTTWLMAAILKIDMTSYFGDDPIWMKFGSRMQNNTPITAKWFKWVEFQYGGRLFFKNGSSYISAVNWGISTKFGWLIDISLPSEGSEINKYDTGSSIKRPRVRDRHLEKWIWRHISAVGTPIWTKYGSLMQNNTQITAKWSTSKAEVEFQDGGRLFFKNGSIYISAVNWDMSTKFGLLIYFDLPNTVASQIGNRK